MEWFKSKSKNFLIFSLEEGANYLQIFPSPSCLKLTDAILQAKVHPEMLPTLFKQIEEHCFSLTQEQLPVHCLSLSPSSILFDEKTQSFVFTLLPLLSHLSSDYRKDEILELFFFLYQNQTLPFDEATFLELSFLLEKNLLDFLQRLNGTSKENPKKEEHKKEKVVDCPPPSSPILLEKEETHSSASFSSKPKTNFLNLFQTQNFYLLILGLSLIYNFYLFFSTQDFSIFLKGTHFFSPLISLLALILFLIPTPSKAKETSYLTSLKNHLLYLKLNHISESTEEVFVLSPIPFVLANSLKFNTQAFLYHFEAFQQEFALEIFIKKDKFYLKNLSENLIQLRLEKGKKTHIQSLFPEDSMLLPSKFCIGGYTFHFYLQSSKLFQEETQE